MIDMRIVGASGHIAEVLHGGEVAVAARHFSRPVSIKLDVAGQAYNFASPVPGSHFVITEIILTADKNVTTDTLVEIYEASAADSMTVDKAIFTIEMLKNSAIPMTGLNWEVRSGKYLNAKCDDDDVYATIAYHIHPDAGDEISQVGIGEDA